VCNVKYNYLNPSNISYELLANFKALSKVNSDVNSKLSKLERYINYYALIKVQQNCYIIKILFLDYYIGDPQLQNTLSWKNSRQRIHGACSLARQIWWRIVSKGWADQAMAPGSAERKWSEFIRTDLRAWLLYASRPISRHSLCMHASPQSYHASLSSSVRPCFLVSVGLFPSSTRQN